jgi:hypothetical protein
MKRTDPAATAHLFRRLTWEELDPEFLRRLILLEREEDLRGAGLARPSAAAQAGDVTTAALSTKEEACAHVVARQALCVCGLPLLQPILEAYGGGIDIELLFIWPWAMITRASGTTRAVRSAMATTAAAARSRLKEKGAPCEGSPSRVPSS